MRRLVAVIAILCASPAAAQALGETTFPTSGAPAAQPDFVRGLLWLHSFEYDDARDAFRAARRLDPGFAMAAWGEAMTHNHPIWMEQDSAAAVAALDALPSGAPATARERAYLDAARVLFQGAPLKQARDDLYAERMVGLAEASPADDDLATFAALALLGTAHEGRDVATYMRAAALAEEVFARTPRHPGAAHYLIHAYDDPDHAPLGLRAARVYADLAPDASHALHMPTHIFVAMGEWAPVRDLNERSYGAARAASDRRGEALNGHGWHALYWWHYAATQLRDEPLMNELSSLARAEAAAHPSDLAASHWVRMQAQQAVASERWDALRHAAPSDTPSLSTAAVQAHARGLAALAAGDAEAASGLLGALSARVDALPDPGRAPWSARAAVLLLRAAIRSAGGDEAASLDALRAAAALEAEAPIAFGPPALAVPPHEALGAALLAAGRPAEALAAFEAALRRAPNRWQAVGGRDAARAALAAR